ncbi:aminoglycoside phosphotransferase family protein [Pseudanabaena sp. FACHB-1998]|uniref:phosphotransferase enzyme family protein n=1 Tax=Pseudanabaena sp. FACHB-1998 TaxID=2692858 RepID=UPI00167FEC94|nr:aminoglycoside phosphotransferase family protein [Pseudanabaena sp. FACHB-1998]MBD2175448.1 aminoglycoside phosphotransferase family protein [Pseudanabaena sp. FACHB-1998]
MSQNQELQKLIHIGSQFSQQETITQIQAFGSGNINATFLASGQGLNPSPFILQRINTNVFRNPKQVMQNMRIYADHVSDRLQKNPLQRRWEVPQVRQTGDGQDYIETANGEFWRSLSFIENSHSFDALLNVDHAREVGYALGTFHHLTSDLDSAKLADTLVGFHITPLYLEQYTAALATSEHLILRSPEVNYCLNFVESHKYLAHILEAAKASGKLLLRTMHGDPKVNNILFDKHTHLAVSVVDLDTIKAGLIHYDIGDCLRSGCNPSGEECEQWEDVEFSSELCFAILQGYLSQASSFLTESDYAYIYDSIRVITFELGLRFFTDYLLGNVYFAVKYPEHNLLRSLVQFRLLESIEAQKPAINHIIEKTK